MVMSQLDVVNRHKGMEAADTVDIAVVGGGLSGLIAAATANRAGRRAVVFESHKPGGRARVTEKDGFRFNMGGHAIYPAGETPRILAELGVGLPGASPPLGRYRIRWEGTNHRFPTGPGSLLSTSVLGWRSKASLSVLLARLPRLRPADLEGKSVEDWLGDLGLARDSEAVLRALLRLSTYSIDFSDFGADAALMQLQRAVDSTAFYVHGGWQTMVDALSGKVDIRDHSRVECVRASDGCVEVVTARGVVRARAAVVAAGTPDGARALLASKPDWGDVGPAVTAACLDVAVRGVPDPGYVLGADEPLFGTTQAPPAQQAPQGDAVVAVIRYGARSADEDRRDVESWLAHIGVAQENVVHSRFLARMTVTGAQPRAVNGGLRGRPSVTSTDMDNVFIAGDWVGPDGLLVDAAAASARAAALAAVHAVEREGGPKP